MEKKRLKETAQDMAEKGFDRVDVVNMVEARCKVGKLTVEEGKYIIKKYDEIKEEVEAMSIGFFV